MFYVTNERLHPVFFFFPFYFEAHKHTLGHIKKDFKARSF